MSKDRTAANDEPAPAFEAVLIPGGGLTATGELPEHVRLRFDAARAVQGAPLLIALSRGTVHRPPPLDESGFPICESRAGAAYLLAGGIPRERILVEELSLDTIGNAYFARTLHTDPLRIGRLLVITSEFHAERTRAIFDWVFDLPGSHGYQMSYLATSDGALPEATLAARTKREQSSLEKLNATRARIRTLDSLHRFMHREHDAYAPGGRPSRSGKLERETY